MIIFADLGSVKQNNSSVAAAVVMNASKRQACARRFWKYSAH
jgi:hypothetical protein